MPKALERTCANCLASRVCDVRRSNIETFNRLAHLDEMSLINRGTWMTEVDRLTARACEVFAPDPRYDA